VFTPQPTAGGSGGGGSASGSTGGCKGCGVVGCKGNCGGSAQPTKLDVIDLTLVKQEPDEVDKPQSAAGSKKAIEIGIPPHWTEPNDEDKRAGDTIFSCLNNVLLDSEEGKAVLTEFRKNLCEGCVMITRDDIAYRNGKMREPPPGNYIRHEFKSLPLEWEPEALERVQNLTEYAANEVFKKTISLAGKVPVIETIYHGTSKDIAKKIAKTKFDRGYTHNTRFGHGAYGDTRGEVALHHAYEGQRNIQGAVGYVVIGKCVSSKIGKTQGNSREPPTGCDIGGSGDDYDTLFRVSFRDGQFVPEYVLRIRYTGSL
jgi:hypothetical protein